MSWWLLLIPVISAILGWFINRTMIKMLFYPEEPKKILGITLQGLIPKRKLQFAKGIAGMISAELFSFKEIEEKIINPESFKKIMPQVELHIDHFLRVKLAETMPMISMFIGDKTINQLKTVFIAELEQLFPEIMKKYMANLQEDVSLEKMIEQKIASYPAKKIEIIFLQSMKKELRAIEIIGGVSGFIIGLLQVLITLLIAR
jgi:uncharacterized membrane protein YheB (UPF0754 family)